MIDHIYLPVSDLERSSEFYKKVLEPLGIDMPYEVGQPPIRGFAINNIPGFWLKNGEIDDVVERQHAAIFRDHPFLQPSDQIHWLRCILQTGDVRAALHLN